VALSWANDDRSRFVLPGLLSPIPLARLIALSDLHVYRALLSELSWSLWNALACEATVLASEMALVRGVIEPSKHGLLVGFFDVEGMVGFANRVLEAPEEYRHVGQLASSLLDRAAVRERCVEIRLTSDRLS
jgi:hypothetical protein